MSSILVVPVQPCDNDSISAIISPLNRIFRIPASVDSEEAIDPSFAFDVYRNQFNSSALIAAFIQRFKNNRGKIIGVTSVDLFVPVLTYVFGEAQLDGPFAVVSAHRLDDTLYGLPANPALLQERLVKEAVHELGHTFGLVHCPDYRCVMHSSTAVEEIDLKSEIFCQTCAALVKADVTD